MPALTIFPCSSTAKATNVAIIGSPGRTIDRFFMVRTAPVSSVNFCFALTRGCFCGFPYWKVFLAFQTIFGLTDRGIEEIADSLVVRIADCISLPVNQSAAAGKQNKDLSEHAGHPALCSIAVTAALEYIHRSDDCTGWLWPIAAHRLSPEGREIHTFLQYPNQGRRCLVCDRFSEAFLLLESSGFFGYRSLFCTMCQ